MNAVMPRVVREHASEAAFLHQLRTVVCVQPDQTLKTLGRVDERLVAHLDGLEVSGPAGDACAVSALEGLSSGTAFVAAVRALEGPDARLVARMLALAEASPAARHGVEAAFAWVSPHRLKGITKGLLESTNSVHCQIGLAACAAHGVHPGRALHTALASPDAAMRALAVRIAGEQGLLELRSAVLALLADPQPAVQWSAARSSLLLGGGTSMQAALRCAVAEPATTDHAVRLLLKIGPMAETRDALKQLAQAAPRTRIRAVGVAGDPHFVPWLIQQMEIPLLSRLSGESLGLITGLDILEQGLDRRAPEVADDALDDSADEDDGLPWPDPAKVQAWWHANQHRFVPGVRYFIGEPPAWEHCRCVLRAGYQRQRIGAAEYLCLLRPGTPLFDSAAPAWRQRRLLDAQGAT